jgi:hypothetical protein
MDEQREWEAIRSLQRLYGDTPQNVPDKSETPDFRFPRLGGVCLGVEVTEYFRKVTVEGSPLQAEVALTDKLLQSCMALHNECGIDPTIVVTVMFRPNARIRDTHAGAVALVEAVAAEAANIGWSTEILNDGQMPSWAAKLVAYRKERQSEPLWLSSGTAWPVPIEIDEISAIIAEKEQKLAAYRQKCAEVWLLVVIDLDRVSSIAELSDIVAREAFETGFDRVILLHGTSSIIQLNTRPS